MPDINNIQKDFFQGKFSIMSFLLFMKKIAHTTVDKAISKDVGPNSKPS